MLQCVQAHAQHVADTIETKIDTLKESLVTAEIKVLQVKGDTLVFNIAGTQQTTRNEMLYDVLQKLPGVEVDGGSVKVMGEDISKIYINGKLLFGDNITDALNYLSGQEVVSIKTYHQQRAEDRKIGNKAAAKEKVMDVKTRHFFDNVLVAEGIAAAGRNTILKHDQTDYRYHGSLSSNYFSEKNLLSAILSSGSVGYSQNDLKSIQDISSIPNDFTRNGYAGISFVKKLGDPEIGNIFSASYSFADEDSFSSSSVSRGYNNASNEVERLYFSNTERKRFSKVHSVRASAKFSNNWMPMVSLSMDIRKDSSLLSRNQAESISGFHESSLNKEQRDNINGRLSLYKGMRITDAVTLMYDAYVSKGSSENNQTQADSSSYGLKRYFAAPSGDDFRVHISPEIHYSFNETNSIVLHYSFDYFDTKSKILKYENTGNEMNLISALCEDYTKKGQDHHLSLTMESFKKSTIKAGITSEVYVMDKAFVHIAPTFSWARLTPLSTIMISFYSSQSVPSLEQLSTAIRNDNPLYVTSGNENLEQSHTYNMMISTRKAIAKSSSTISSSFRGSIQTGSILQHSLFYKDGGSINGFVIQPGTTLSSWKNAEKESYMINYDFIFETYLKPIKSRINTTLGYSFSHAPIYVNEKEANVTRHSPQFAVSLKGSFKRKYKLDFTFKENPSIIKNDSYGDNCWFDQSVKIGSQNQITPWFFINASFSHNSRLSAHSQESILKSNVLNAMAGFTLLGGDLNIGIGCYDILGDAVQFSSKYIENYLQTTRTNTYGQVCVLSIIYRFNSTQHGGKSVSFGREAPRLGTRFETKNDYIVKY